MVRQLSQLFGIVIVLAGIITPMVIAQRQLLHTRHFSEVTPGVLYRSGQLTESGLRQVVHDYGIRTIISLRLGVSETDRKEEAFCAREEIQFLRLPPLHWNASAGVIPVQENIERFLALVADPAKHPILVHCFAGTHRTGAYCAIYRMEFEGWSNDQAIAEVKAHGYHNLEGELDILGYLQSYRPRLGRTLPTTPSREREMSSMQ